MSSTEALEARVQALEGQVASLLDRASIQDLRFRYHVAVNDKQLGSIGSLFTDDAEVHFERIGSARGRAEIEDLYRDVVGKSPFVKQFIHNHLIILKGNAASGLSYLEAKTITDGESYLVAARFDDEYTRVGDEWRFSRLSLSLYYAVPLREGWVGEDRIRLPS